MLLEVQHATKRYSALTVVDDLSFGVEAGEALGIVGPNGAGKTTALSLVAGDVPLSGGTVRFDGEDISRTAPHARCRAGIGRTFQVPRPFASLTVFENVMVGALHGGSGGEAAAVDALARTGLLAQANTPARSLTLLDRKRLEVARALVTEPRILLLDESAGGLTEAEVHAFLPLVHELKAAGTAIVWIEHVVHALLATVDRILCIDRGRKLIEGEPRAVMASREVREIYLGVPV
jgi:branched-chain amino acid transport system ATP-binding protein